MTVFYQIYKPQIKCPKVKIFVYIDTCLSCSFLAESKLPKYINCKWEHEKEKEAKS